MVYYQLVKIIINASELAEVIIDMIVHYYGLSDSIVPNKSSFFIVKFWSLLYYFFGIKHWLSIVFYAQIDSQIKKQISTIEVYFQAFVNFKQNDWARPLPIAEYTYDNAKNVSTGHMPFKLNCGYYLCVFFEENTNPHSRSKSIDELLAELQNLMTVCQKNLQHAQNL